MDTRTKIIALEAAAELAGTRRTRVVSGYFDPLLASHAARLAELRAADPESLLLVAVLEPPKAILDRRARAELVAALAVVDRVVVIEDGDAGACLNKIPAAAIYHEEDADRERTRAFTQHVQRRHHS